MKRIALLLLLLPSLAFAQPPSSVWDPINGRFVPVQGDAAGTVYQTERYPATSTCVTLANGLTLAAGAGGIGGVATAPFPSANIYLHKSIRIRATGWGPPDSNTVNFYLQGSIDGFTYQFLTRSHNNRTAIPVRYFINNIGNVGIASPGAITSFNEAISSSPSQTDTLGWIWDATSAETSTTGIWIINDDILSQIPPTFPFIRVMVFNRTVAAGGTLTYDVEMCGRK